MATAVDLGAYEGGCGKDTFPNLCIHPGYKAAVGARLALGARNIALGSRSGKISAARQAKLLGTTSGGGRRRAVKFLAVRRTAFAKRVPRTHVIRRAGVSAIQATRAAGIPVLTYGADTCGTSPSQLLSARR